MKSRTWLVLFAVLAVSTAGFHCDGDAGTDVQYCTTVRVDSEPTGVAVTVRVDGEIKSCMTPCSLEGVPVGQNITFAVNDCEGVPTEVPVTRACAPISLPLITVPNTDADADSDSDTTDESTSCPACPSVAGNWSLTYHSDVTGAEWTVALRLDQNGDSVTGSDPDCEYSGNIAEGGALSLTGDCPPHVWTVNATLVDSTHLDGTFSSDGGGYGSWRAVRR